MLGFKLIYVSKRGHWSNFDMVQSSITGDTLELLPPGTEHPFIVYSKENMFAGAYIWAPIQYKDDILLV